MDGFCKACLFKHEDPTELLQYTEKNKRLFVYSTGLQVKANDALPFQLCRACFVKMKMACQFKKQCRTADKRLNNFLALKESGEVIELADYLQMNDGLFKFPLNATPSYQKPKEDDNVSTSTSIRNFVTDFLREDQVPDTEAHIIREMIEQEADVLDDSLDSHWLQDDISIASDFRFSPFSTPLPKHNYQPLLNYSPVKEEKTVEENSGRRNILAAKKLFLEPTSCSSSETSSLKSKDSSDQNTFLAAKKMLINEKSNIKIEDDAEQKYLEEQDKKSYLAMKRILLNSKQSNKNQIAPEGKDIETYLATKSILADSNYDKSDKETNAKSPNKELLTNVNKLKEDKGQITPKGFYVQIGDDDEENKDSIDKNIEKLLNTTNDDVISLSALLASPSKETIPYCNEIIATPSVHRGLSGANTPTIANILFGENLDDDQKSAKQRNPDQEKVMVTDDDDGVDILEDFFNKETGEYLGENVPIKDELFEEYTSDERLPMPGKSQYDLTDFSCKKCNVSYKSQRGLKLHFAKAHNSKIVTQRNKEPRLERSCDRCGKVFHCKSNMARHMKDVHLNPKKAQNCKLCSLKFTSENKLKLHMKSHGPFHEHKALRDNKNKLNLVCPICGHMSTQTSNLNVHIARHNKQYLFTCDPCGQGFYRKTDLRIHMRIHMNEKPFKCSHCPKDFRRKDQLVNHIKKHTGERMYTCEICGRNFITNMKLLSHMRNSEVCKNKKLQAAIKANKAIEESIEQIYLEETSICIGNEKMHAVRENAFKNNEKAVTGKIVTVKDVKTVKVKDEKPVTVKGGKPVTVKGGKTVIVKGGKIVTVKDGKTVIVKGVKIITVKYEKTVKDKDGKTVTVKDGENAAGAKKADDKIVDVKLEDLIVNHASNSKEPTSSLDDDDDDKTSLSELFTIPKIIKDDT